MISIEAVKDFRKNLRHFERALEMQNNSNCCCGVTLTQCHALMELDKENNISLKDLAGGLSLDKSTSSRVVESLVNQGLVEREIPKNNRRTTLIRLTKQGVAVCKSINTSNNEYYQKVLDSLSKNQLSVFLDAFELVVKTMLDENKKKTGC